MENISTFGLSGYLIATRTLPIGILINRWADDVDSIAVTEATTGEAVLDLNGSVISWTVATPLTVALSVIPNTIDDDMLSIIYNSNRVSKTSPPVGDSINLVLRYPNGGVRVFTTGRVVSGPSSPTARAEGRMASNTYTYAFGDQYSLTPAAALNAIAQRLDVFGSIGGLVGF
ncbi:hypothetical protein D3C81_527780 [compost metagenome]